MQKKSFAAAVKAAFPHTIPIMTGYLAGAILRRADGLAGATVFLVGAGSAFASLRQHAVCGHHAADHGLIPAGLYPQPLRWSNASAPIFLTGAAARKLGTAAVFHDSHLCDENFPVLLGGAAGGGGSHPVLLRHEPSHMGVLGAVLHAGRTGGQPYHLRHHWHRLRADGAVRGAVYRAGHQAENQAPGAIGLVCSVVGLAVFGADNMVIPAMVLTLIVLLVGRRKLCA